MVVARYAPNFLGRLLSSRLSEPAHTMLPQRHAGWRGVLSEFAPNEISGDFDRQRQLSRRQSAYIEIRRVRNDLAVGGHRVKRALTDCIVNGDRSRAHAVNERIDQFSNLDCDRLPITFVSVTLQLDLQHGGDSSNRANGEKRRALGREQQYAHERV